MAKCRYCGRDIDPNSQFCPYCNCINPIKKDDANWSGDTKKEEAKAAQNQTSVPKEGQPIPPHQPVNRPPKGFNPPLDKMNGMAIAGFVTSFFFPFIGLPFSITAYDRCRYDNYRTNIRYAKAGIIISIIMLVAWIITIIVLIAI